MTKQITDTFLMIEPVSFGFNDQTAVNNYFQQKVNEFNIDIQELALKEFNEMVEKLRANDINILVVKDTLQPHKPDSIFPNNWVTFHGEGQVVLYPMYAENRRKERRNEIFEYLIEQGCSIKNIDDFSFWEEQNLFLEGTGSMILDRENRIAFASLSERTDKSVFLQFCKVFEFKPIFFKANQHVNNTQLPIYHTNVMLSIAEDYAVICSESIDNKAELQTILDALDHTKKEIITISEQQMLSFAGNMLQVKNKSGKRFLIMSESAYNSLEKNQINTLKAYNELLVISIPTIEKIGGGSVRCMMAEIF